MKRYDLFEYISQRENGEMPKENERLVSISNVIRNATKDCGGNEGESSSGNDDVNLLVNEREKRLAEEWAKSNNCWIPFSKIFDLGIPGPSGSESDTYISEDGYVYKTNNLMHCHDSLMVFLGRTLIYNLLFPDSAYDFVGFTGFDGRSVFPVLRQRHIKDSVPAKQNEIDCYMSAIGFDKIGDGTFVYDKLVVSDLFPKNVLVDATGDIFVIDVEIGVR